MFHKRRNPDGFSVNQLRAWRKENVPVYKAALQALSPGELHGELEREERALHASVQAGVESLSALIALREASRSITLDWIDQNQSVFGTLRDHLAEVRAEVNQQATVGDVERARRKATESAVGVHQGREAVQRFAEANAPDIAHVLVQMDEATLGEFADMVARSTRWEWVPATEWPRAPAGWHLAVAQHSPEWINLTRFPLKAEGWGFLSSRRTFRGVDCFLWGLSKALGFRLEGRFREGAEIEGIADIIANEYGIFHPDVWHDWLRIRYGEIPGVQPYKPMLDAKEVFENLPKVLTYSDGSYLAGPIPAMPGPDGNDAGVLEWKFGRKAADALGVCVAEGHYGYLRRIQLGSCEIYGIFRPNGKALFCIEVGVNQIGVRFVAQIKGRGNRLPGYPSTDTRMFPTKWDEVQKAIDACKALGVNPNTVADLNDGLMFFLKEGKVHNPRRHLRVRNPESRWHCSWCRIPREEFEVRNG